MFNDGNRVYPVNKLVMHHAVSDNMVNWSDLAVQDWFSNVGKKRGYSDGAVFSYHEHPGRTGQATYSMAHFCLHRYTKDGNKYGWRLTELIKNPFQQVAWHCGNWSANQTSIGIETAGNYESSDIDDKALMLIADKLGRAWDKELISAKVASGVNVYGHRDWIATACPGKIYNKIDTLIDMINNKSKWERALWPPTTKTKEETKKEAVAFTTRTIENSALPKGEQLVTQVGVNGERTIVYTITLKNGKEIKRTIKSDTITRKPIDQVKTIGTYQVPSGTTKGEPTDYDKQQDSKLAQFTESFTAILAGVVKMISDFIASVGKK